MTKSSDDILAGLLAECSNLILAGATVESCLDRYPQHAAALASLLTTVAEVHQLSTAPVRPAAPAARTREQFMAAALQLSAERRAVPVSWWERLQVWWAGIVALFAAPSRGRSMPVGLIAALLIVILAGVMVTGGVTASARSLPGDLLYPVKTTSERVRLLLARDPTVRSVLEQEFAGRRLQEARAVAEQGRRINSLPLDGILEAINVGNWTVSGLELTLDPGAQIIGTPAVGARVRGVLRAPGDGRLIVVYAEIEAPAGGGATAPIATPPTAPPTRPAATATATLTPTPTPISLPSSVASQSGLPGQEWREPEDWSPAVPTATTMPTAVRTATRRPLPTATPASTLAPTPTNLPPAREQPTYKIEGYVERIEGNKWIIDGIPVRVTGATQLIGTPGVGWKVSALVVQEEDGSYTALQIAAVAPPEATPEPVEFTDFLQETNGEWWIIGGIPVRIRGDTVIDGDPQIGDLVSVKGQRHMTEIWALRIVAIRLTEVQFDGIISAVSGSSLVIGGHTVLIDAKTQIIGTPEVGRLAQVSAWQMPDGRLIGRIILVLDATPTPTMTATQQPTQTPTPTATAKPTGTPTLEPTPTATPEPTATPTLEPTATPTLEPTPTPTPEALPELTAEPTSTATPEAAASPNAVPSLRRARSGA